MLKKSFPAALKIEQEKEAKAPPERSPEDRAGKGSFGTTRKKS